MTNACALRFPFPQPAAGMFWNSRVSTKSYGEKVIYRSS